MLTCTVLNYKIFLYFKKTYRYKTTCALLELFVRATTFIPPLTKRLDLTVYMYYLDELHPKDPLERMLNIKRSFLQKKISPRKPGQSQPPVSRTFLWWVWQRTLLSKHQLSQSWLISHVQLSLPGRAFQKAFQVKRKRLPANLHCVLQCARPGAKGGADTLLLHPTRQGC